MKRLTLIFLALLATLTIAAARPTAAKAEDSTAVAVNLRDGADIFRLAFHIVRTQQDVVDNSNAAVAFASCSDCQTIAVAFQVVLVFSDPSVVDPTNLALAYNFECTSCDTLASAYQWVLTTGGPVHFTAAGNQQIAELRRQLRDLLASDLPIDQMQTQIDQIAAELQQVIQTELVPAGNSGGSQSGGSDTTTTETTPTTTTETTPTDTTGTTTTDTTTTTP
jgi:putative peptide zinc metalloprotease protein